MLPRAVVYYCVFSRCSPHVLSMMDGCRDDDDRIKLTVTIVPFFLLLANPPLLLKVSASNTSRRPSQLGAAGVVFGCGMPARQPDGVECYVFFLVFLA